MGAWGVFAFENDNALDWVWGLEEADGISTVSDTLEAVADAAELSEDCEEAIAAAEVVAALRGKPLDDLPEEISAFVAGHGKQKPSPKLVKLASTVVERITESSALKARWNESKHAEAWHDAMQDLLRRLKE